MVVGRKEESDRFFSHLYNVVIKQQPEAVALDDSDVVSAVGTTAEQKQRDVENCGKNSDIT